MSETVAAMTLTEMVAYYQARANEYDEWFNRQGRYDRGPQINARWFLEMDEVFAALDALAIAGDVLELACGTGIWTQQLLRTASSISAFDASPAMLTINRAKVASDRVSYVQTDLFSWQPIRTYDAVCFAFWISHVPIERLDPFLSTVASALRPGGKLFFVDDCREPTGSAVDHHFPKEENQLMNRRLNDGRTFQIVKNFYEPGALRARFAMVGLDITVCETASFFLYGVTIFFRENPTLRDETASQAVLSTSPCERSTLKSRGRLHLLHFKW